MDFSKLIEDDFTADFAKDIIQKLSPYPYLADLLIILTSFAGGALLAFLLFLLLRRILHRFYRRHCEMNAELLACIRRMIVSFVGCLPVVFVSYSIWCDGMHEWVAVLICKPLWGIVIALLTLTVTYGIKSFGLWYKQQLHAEQRPIDGLLRIAVSFVWAAAIILFISLLIEKSPVYLLSGLGAIAAVVILLLQHTILSFVASVEINVDHLVEIGDWIVMESDEFEDVDGIVTEITLHTVKVRNWNRTQVCLPICYLVNKPFVNYSAMIRGGGRRIKRAVLIDQRSIRFLTPEEIEVLKGFDILKDYLESQEKEIAQYNAGRSLFNTRCLTNLGVFRIYAKRYLEHHPKIRGDLTLFVRELAPTSTGVPLEIYGFSNEVKWVPFEEIQSEIMEHLLAVMPSFRLRVFQECSDIYQEIGDQIDVVGGAFRFDRLKNPVYPNNGRYPGEQDQ
ncbi:MAG: mechanosensitive ion channel family protein [Lentisphaeria bacterium]|nr:mechanosensitive ion channel family protein [Lentisphaeria bacterium]